MKTIKKVFRQIKPEEICCPEVYTVRKAKASYSSG